MRSPRSSAGDVRTVFASVATRESWRGVALSPCQEEIRPAPSCMAPYPTPTHGGYLFCRVRRTNTLLVRCNKEKFENGKMCGRPTMALFGHNVCLQSVGPSPRSKRSAVADAAAGVETDDDSRKAETVQKNEMKSHEEE